MLKGCVMKKSLLSVAVSLLLTCAVAPHAYATDASTTASPSTTTTSPSTTTTGTTTTTTTNTSNSHKKPRPAIDFGQGCSGGGTRTVEGGLDTATGIIDLTTTLAACKTRNGQVFDGKTVTTGTLKVETASIAIDVKTVIDMKMTRSDGTSVTRTCTMTKVGAFTQRTQTFDGTTTRTDCTVTGAVRDHEGVVEHLLRSAITDDETGGDDPLSRLLPEQDGESRGSSGRR
jgi:hypothetical protein